MLMSSLGPMGGRPLGETRRVLPVVASSGVDSPPNEPLRRVAQVGAEESSAGVLDPKAERSAKEAARSDAAHRRLAHTSSAGLFASPLSEHRTSAGDLMAPRLPGLPEPASTRLPGQARRTPGSTRLQGQADPRPLPGSGAEAPQPGDAQRSVERLPLPGDVRSVQDGPIMPGEVPLPSDEQADEAGVAVDEDTPARLPGEQKDTNSAGSGIDEQRTQEMQRRDAEVRRHEMAHAAAGGGFAGAPSYDLERGPDGAMYAVAGRVRIDVSPVPGDPKATLRKMRQVKQAALAPADPSPQDRRVAARASALMARAQTEVQNEQETEGPTPAGSGGVTMMSLHAKRAYEGVRDSVVVPPDD